VSSLKEEKLIKSKPTQKLKHANSILEYFEHFCQMTSKSIHIISSYTVSKLRRFFETQCILSVIDSAMHYLWLLRIQHKTAECVAATLFDEVISRVSVPSTILTDQGTEFMAEVVECLLRRLGISHLRTSAYHPQTDDKCERVHFSVHNIITKLIDDKHDRWPDLLGTVALAYNATVHTSTGYSPHELFHSFAPS